MAQKSALAEIAERIIPQWRAHAERESTSTACERMLLRDASAELMQELAAFRISLVTQPLDALMHSARRIEHQAATISEALEEMVR